MAEKHSIEFRVVGASQWGFSTSPDGKDARLFGGGTPDAKTHVEDFTAKELPLLAGAEADGVVEIVKAPKAARSALSGHVQSQADGEKAYAEAQADGRWHYGNVAQHVADVETRAAAHREATKADASDGAARAQQATFAAQADQSRQILAELDGGADYETAVRRVLGQEAR